MISGSIRAGGAARRAPAEAAPAASHSVPTIGSSSHFSEVEAERIAESAQSAGSSIRPTVSGEQLHELGEAAPVSVQRALLTRGSPLDRYLRTDMEGRLGHDFSNVSIHADSAAAEAAEDIGARAFSVGPALFFSRNAFDPVSADGRKLLAHELAHTAQYELAARHFGSPSIPVVRRDRKPGGEVKRPKYTLYSIKLEGRRVTLVGNQGNLVLEVTGGENLPSGTYKVTRNADDPTGLDVHNTGVQGSGEKNLLIGLRIPDPPNAGKQVPQREADIINKGLQRKLEMLTGYIDSLATSVQMTVVGGPRAKPKFKVIDEEATESGDGGQGTGEKENTQDSGTPQEPGTGTTTDGGKQGRGQAGDDGTSRSQKVEPAFAEKLQALFDGKDDKPIDDATMQKLKEYLDKLSLEDITLFKSVSRKGSGSDHAELLKSLELFVAAKAEFEKQKIPENPAPLPDGAQKILADALKKFDAKNMTADQKEELARATVRSLSNDQLKSMTLEQIAEGVVRIDKASLATGKDMSEGMERAIKGSGWEKVAGAAQGIKGASGFWAILSTLALVAAMFVPGLNAMVLAAHAMAAGLIAYAAATIQQEAEIKAARSAETVEQIQGNITRGAEARSQAILTAASMAIPAIAKFAGKIPLPGNLKNVATAMKMAKTQLVKGGSAAFNGAKTLTLDAIAKAKTNLRPQLAEFRIAMGKLAMRIRGAKTAELLNEIRKSPELSELLPKETLQAMEKLSGPELEVARKGLLETINNAPDAAEILTKNIESEVAALEARAKEATTAKELEAALDQSAALTDPERLTNDAAEATKVEVAQNRINRISKLSLDDVRQEVNGLLKDSQNLLNKNEHAKGVFEAAKEMNSQLNALEKQQGKKDIGQQLEDISQRASELDDLIADSAADLNQQTADARAAALKKKDPPKQSPAPTGEQPKPLREGNEYDAAHQFDYPYRELYTRTKDGRHRLDGYDPGKWIVSRKKVQLSEIPVSESKAYIGEFKTKYARGTLIDDVPSAGLQTGGAPVDARLTGTLQGEYIMEVPVQGKPVPAEVLIEAKNAGVKIRDVTGKVYELPPTGKSTK